MISKKICASQKFMGSQKIFFSYSRFDTPFALRLAQDLRESGANIWIDQLDIPAGSHWDSAVEKALETADCVLIILSPTSIVSPNVMDEVSYALESGKRIIPVLFVDCLTPFRLRRLQRVDFTNDYTSGLTQLLQSLNLQLSPKAIKEVVSTIEPIAVIHNPDNNSDHQNEWEDTLWEEACTINTISAYKKYLSDTVTGEYKTEARLLIKQLELEQKEDEVDALMWQKAKANHTRALYEHYLAEHPHGNYRTLALAALADLEKFEKTKIHPQDTHNLPTSVISKRLTSDRRRYLILGAGLFVAFMGITGFLKMNNGQNELKAWATALTQNDSLGYSFYLQKFPNGIYEAGAKQKLDSIRNASSIKADTFQTNTIAAIIPQEDTTAKVEVILPVISDTTASKPKVTTNVKPKTPSSNTRTATSKPAAKFKIGQIYQGGIIVYVDQSGEHGLIASAKDEGRHSWEVAHKKCDNYKAEGFIDWRLPTNSELKKMYAARNHMGNYSKGIYWSAEQESKTLAWTCNFNNGSKANSNKMSELLVRPVRSF